MHPFRHVATLTALILVIAAFASPAAFAEDRKETPPAQQTPGWYVGGSAGAVFPGGLSNQPFTVSNGSAVVTSNRGYSLGTGLSLGLQGGYQFNRARVEGEFLYQTGSRNSTPVTVSSPASAPVTISAGGSGINSYSLFVNGYYDIPTSSRFSPYVGAGVGVSWLDASTMSASTFNYRAPGLNRSVFAYQGKLGVSYKLADHASAFFQYRYLGTAGFNYGGATVRIGSQAYSVAPASGSLSNHALELGLRWRL